MMNSISLGFSLLQPFHAPCVDGYPQWGFNSRGSRFTPRVANHLDRSAQLCGFRVI